MRKEIRALHDRLGATSVYVTHDQIEAMTMADHVVVMRAGVIEQQGAPLELYEKPANRFVAGFIGSPAMNFVDGVIGEDGRHVALALKGNARLPIGRDLAPGTQVIVGLRPEHIRIGAPDEAPGAFTIGTIEATGAVSYIFSDDTPELICVTEGTSQLRPGETVGFSIEPDKIHLFDPETEAAIG